MRGRQRPAAHGAATAASAYEAVAAAFAAGCASFSREGFRFGDPSEHLHPPGHEHWRRPQFATCKNCAPPVQGCVVLLHTKPDGSGDVEVVHGQDAIASDGCSWKRHWRVLNIGVNLAKSTTDYSSTNESVRARTQVSRAATTRRLTAPPDTARHGRLLGAPSLEHALAPRDARLSLAC